MNKLTKLHIQIHDYFERKRLYKLYSEFAVWEEMFICTKNVPFPAENS